MLFSCPLKAGSLPRFATTFAIGLIGIAGVYGLEISPRSSTTGVSSPIFKGTAFGDPQLDALVRKLLAKNPLLAAQRARGSVHREREIQERALPDPQLSFRYFVRTPETRIGAQRQALELSQVVPWVGKRVLQAKRASFLAAREEREADSLARHLIAELKAAYFDVAYLQEAIEVNREEVELLRRFEAIALVRYRTGQGIQQEVIKVQTDLTRLADRKIALAQRLAAVSRRIAELIGHPNATLELTPITLFEVRGEFDARLLERSAIEQHPNIQALERKIDADESWLARRRLDRWPNFRFGIGYVQIQDRDDPAGLLNPPAENGKDIFSLTIGLNIPIYRRRISAGIAEAAHGVRVSEKSLRTARDHQRYRVQEELLRLEALRERTALYRDTLIPQARESLASAEAAYTTNRQGFLDLLDAERVLFEARLSYHRLLADSWSVLAEIEFTAGRPLSEGAREQ